MEGRSRTDTTLSDDTALIERARGGDSAAFGMLAERHQPAALHLACVILGDGHEAEDVTQEALLKAYVALPRFKTDAPFQPWLLQIVANEARNRRRAAGRRVHLAMRVADTERPSRRGMEPSPEALAVQDEQRRMLLAEVAALRDEDRLAIAGRYFLDLSEAQLADLLGCARGTVKSRLSRGLVRLRRRLNAHRELLVLLLALAALAAGLLAWPEARAAIATRLGLRGIAITHRPAATPADVAPAAPATRGAPPGEAPAVREGSAVASDVAPVAPVATTDAAGAAARMAAALGLGSPVTRTVAVQRLGRELLLPRGLGQPDAIYAADGEVWLAYAPRDGLPPAPQSPGLALLLTEINAPLDLSILGKGIPPGSHVEDARVNGQRAVWIDAAPHVLLRTPNGSFRDIPPRLAGNTLVWEQADLTLRIESALDRAAALGIAESLDGTR